MDRNADTARIAAANGHFYQLQPSGAIYQYPEIPCTSRCSGAGWWLRDIDPAATAIYADGNVLYKQRRDGTLWQSNNGSSWSIIDDGDGPGQRISIAVGGGRVAILYRGGLVSTPVPRWRLWLEAVQIALDDHGNLYFLAANGVLTAWQQGVMDNNPETVAFATGTQGRVYQLHSDGTIWRFTGTYCNSLCAGWERLDNNPATVQIVAAGNDLYQLHGDGSVWRYTGTPCNRDICPGWELMIADGVGRVAAAGNRVYVLSGPTAPRPPRAPVCSECL